MDRSPLAAWHRETASCRDDDATRTAGGQLILQLGRKDVVQFRLSIGHLQALVTECGDAWAWSVGHGPHVLSRGSAPSEESAMAAAEESAAGLAREILGALSLLDRPAAPA